MKDNTKEKAPNIPTEKELLEFGIFYKKSTDEGFCKMNGWIEEKYINPKKEKQKILSMLQ